MYAFECSVTLQDRVQVRAASSRAATLQPNVCVMSFYVTFSGESCHERTAPRPGAIATGAPTGAPCSWDVALDDDPNMIDINMLDAR